MLADARLIDYTTDERFSSADNICLFAGDCMEFLASCPNNVFQLIVTSPPYNLGKEYEKRLRLDDYVRQQAAVIHECVRTLGHTGSLC